MEHKEYKPEHSRKALLTYLLHKGEIPLIITEPTPGSCRIELDYLKDGAIGAISEIMIAQNPDVFGAEEAEQAIVSLKELHDITFADLPKS